MANKKARESNILLVVKLLLRLKQVTLVYYFIWTRFSAVNVMPFYAFHSSVYMVVFYFVFYWIDLLIMSGKLTSSGRSASVDFNFTSFWRKTVWKNLHRHSTKAITSRIELIRPQITAAISKLIEVAFKTKHKAILSNLRRKRVTKGNRSSSQATNGKMVHQNDDLLCQLIIKRPFLPSE